MNDIPRTLYSIADQRFEGYKTESASMKFSLMLLGDTKR